VPKAKEFKVKLKHNYLKRTKPKKNNAPNVKSELKNWMKKVEYVKVAKRSMNKITHMKLEPELILHRKENFLMSSGKVIVVEIKLQKLTGINRPEYPEDYKIN